MPKQVRWYPRTFRRLTATDVTNGELLDDPDWLMTAKGELSRLKVR
jgi:hypothetical protein